MERDFIARNFPENRILMRFFSTLSLLFSAGPLNFTEG
jgi:hypothetical protein